VRAISIAVVEIVEPRTIARGEHVGMFSRGRNSDDSARRRRAFADGSAPAPATAPHTSTRAMPTERRAHTPLADASNALDRARERTALSASKKSAREMARGERTSGARDATTLATTRASLERGLSSVEAVIEDIERQGASPEADARTRERRGEG